MGIVLAVVSSVTTAGGLAFDAITEVIHRLIELMAPHSRLKGSSPVVSVSMTISRILNSLSF